MPLYEYICNACKHEFEEVQKFSDKPIEVCPECKKRKVEKKISLSGFALKGEGWYKDGYAKSNKSTAADSSPAKCDAGTKPATGCGSGKCSS